MESPENVSAPAAVLAHDGQYHLEVLFGRGDEPAHPLDGLGHEGGDLAVGGGLDEFLHIARAAHVTRGVGEPQAAAIAVGVVGVSHIGDGVR